MPSTRLLPALLLAAATLVVSACGGGSGGNTRSSGSVQLDSARTVSATLDATGGNLSVTAADGTRYTLTVPPGALATSTEITATPVLSMGAAPLADGLIGAVRFGPSGLQFALPATLRIEGVNPETSSDTTLVGFLRSNDGASMQLVPPTVGEIFIDIEVLHFSDVGVSEATAQAVATVPVDANADPVAALDDEFMRAFVDTEDEAAEIALLVRLHDTRVVPRLVAAAIRSVATDTEREVAVLVARNWINAVLAVYALDPNDVADVPPGNLGPLITALRQRVLAILNEDFEAGRDACMAPAPIVSAQLVGLQNALRAHAQVQRFNRNGGLPGLDFETVAQRLNDCVRIVFEPRPLPTFALGQPVSLDMRAQLVFAADANASIQVPYAFFVLSVDADVGPDGFSDTLGNYTTVVTPLEADPLFNVEACMTVTLRNGGPVESALCGRQTVGGSPTDVVLAGRATRTFNRVDTSSEVTFAFQGAVDFRVRAEADDTFTVLEALGTFTQVITGNNTCRPDGVTPSTRQLTTRTVQSITRGARFGGGLNTGFQFFGTTTRSTESFVNSNLSCDITTTVNTIDDGDEFGNVFVSGIERDPDGVPTTITLDGSAGQVTGSLQRQ